MPAAWMTLLALCAGVPELAAPAPHVETVIFPAAAERLYTGLWITRGEELKIEASGSWTMWAGHFGHSNAIGHRFRVGSFGWGRLMGRIGSGSELSIGTGLRWTASESGVLVLYPNVGAYGVRGGEGELTITIQGGAPLQQHIEALAAEGTKIVVPADTDGVTADVFVEPGDLVKIDCFGEWRMFEDGPLVTADGDEARRLSDGVPWGRMVARVAGPTFAIDDDIEIGESVELRPKRRGLLQLRPAVGPYAGHRRTGRMEVVIRGGKPADETLRRDALDYATTVERGLGFLQIHQYRQLLSLAPACSDPHLMRAAQAHAEALAQGEADDPAARVAACGFDGAYAGSAVHGYTDGVAAVDGLFAAPYQRAILLQPEARAYGCGVAGGAQPAFVVLVGRSTDPPPHQVRVPEFALFPVASQINVPSSWNGFSEPSPFASAPAGPVGFPVSVTFTDTTVTGVRTAAMANTRGERIECVVLGPGADPHQRLRQTVLVIPSVALTPLDTYEVQLAVETESGPRAVNWRFTCSLNREAVVPAAQMGLPANPEVDLGDGPIDQVAYQPSAAPMRGGRSQTGSTPSFFPGGRGGRGGGFR